MTVDKNAVQSWDGCTAIALADRLRVPRVELFSTVNSTMDVAHSLAERGAAPGTVVLADAQSTGRGRFGRHWTSESARGVWCTVVERPENAGAIELLSIRVGLRLAESLDAAAGERVLVKWPNDLLLRAGKVAGILTEARWVGARLGWVCVGVGVNVEPPRNLRDAAALPAGTRRIDVLEAAVGAVRAAALCAGDLSVEELERLASRDALGTRDVVAPAAGRVAGISRTGALLIDTARGREAHRAGPIRFAGES